MPRCLGWEQDEALFFSLGQLNRLGHLSPFSGYSLVHIWSFEVVSFFLEETTIAIQRPKRLNATDEKTL